MEIQTEIDKKPEEALILALNGGRNRRSKRLAEAEGRKMAEQLLKVESAFLEHIELSDKMSYSYDEIFRHFNNEFVRLCRLCIRVYKPRYTRVNNKYFFNKYANKN